MAAIGETSGLGGLSSALAPETPLSGVNELYAVLDLLPLGVAVLDRQRRVLFLNKNLEHLTGYALAEARRVPLRHILRSGVREPGFGESQEPPRTNETDIINRHRRRIPVRLTQALLALAGGSGLELEIVEDLSQVKELERQAQGASGAGEILSRGEAMDKIKRILAAVAESDAPVLISGETGTGKDMVALAVHRNSPRARGPFVRVSCGPMPEAVLETELYGRGEDAGMAEAREGKFQQASGGTLYLSEICDLPPEQQARLVRYLDEGAIYPLGAELGVKVNVRLVAATHRDPGELVKSGQLREDLYYRLCVARLNLPPLRERGEDVEFLLEHFLKVFAARFKKSIEGFSAEARRILTRYAYPGNVRELKNIVEYAAMVCPGGMVTPEYLPAHVCPLGSGDPEPLPQAALKRAKNPRA